MNVLGLSEIDRSHLAQVGGKGAGLGELARIEGIRVPEGFCVTTGAFRRALAPVLAEPLERLARVAADDREGLRAQSAELRRLVEATLLPDDVAADITAALGRLDGPVAVRSSATAEDLPAASFAGQQDSFLGVSGTTEVLRHVVRCWASLFTERAVAYRARSGYDHRKVFMAVVVQRMVAPRAAGVMFTADPVSGDRKLASVEAVHGLAEALVAGHVAADVYRVRDGAVVDATRRHDVLTDMEVVRLVELGRRIEAHFGRPQDIEWCLDDGFHIVQSRPITTLFPVPAVGDGVNRVYLSVGHQQMMTDAMRPLGLSLWQLLAARPMFEAGSRLFVDVTAQLATPAGRAGLMGMAGKSDQLVRDALETVAARDFVATRPDAPPPPAPPGGPPPPIPTDPAIVVELIAASRASIAALERALGERSGPAVFDAILADIPEFKRTLFEPRALQALMAGIEATWWLNDKLEAWLGEKNVADTLAQSAPNNVTSEMGLALLDVADALRPYTDALAEFPDRLPAPARDAVSAFLDRYGARCVGEIDITRPRWAERPATLLPLILANLRNFAPGEAGRRFARGLAEAARKEAEILARLAALPDGSTKAEETKRTIDRFRTFVGYREYPKYGMIRRLWVYKQALAREIERLVRAGVLQGAEDAHFLTLQELHAVALSGSADPGLIAERRETVRVHEALTPPRVLTSDGEAINGSYRREVPPGALAGMAASAGTVEGRARVILDIGAADLEPGDILVTRFTDPSWTPAFVAIRGLVTEVGGLMTHGAVIAREYGLPAVVGVDHATRRIADGQRIRVHGTDGLVELL